MSWKHIKLLIFVCLYQVSQGYVAHHPLPCENIECRPGRECVASEEGKPTCICVQECPDHWKPVCGSDGVSYDNHCLLHKAACESRSHISPTRRRFCKGDREALIARQEFITQLALLNEPSANKIALPDACFENDRNRLREFLMSWFLLSAKKQPWYISGMSRGEELWGHFYTADENKNQKLSPKEWLDYLNRNKTDTGRHREEKDKMRFLCLNALVEEGDSDKDENLDFSEFRKIMAESYSPSRKVCTMEDGSNKYADGAERVSECSACVCACGKWVCSEDA